MKKIANKIVLLSLGCAFLVGISGGIVFYFLTIDKQKDDIELMSETLRSDFDRLIKSEVETMISLLTNINNLATNGELSNEQAKELGINILREIRYGENGYFWADTKDGTNVILLGRDTEGKNRINATDDFGNYFIKDIINNALKGGGYTDYWFPKKSGVKSYPKRGYSEYFEPFDLVVGTGNYIDQIDDVLTDIKVKNKHILKKTILLFIIAVLIILLIATIISLYVGKQISNPIVDVVKKLNLIAKGDLTIDISVKAKDEIKLLANSMQQMITKLRNVISEITSGSDSIASASFQLSSTSESLSQGASEQASSIEEVSSTMEEIAANIEQNTENSQQTEKISIEANVGLGEAAQRSKSTAEANSEIADKISIINDIAFQTNILALNAAVEAARAGEHGKGFAVVAAEVRKLAERSKVAADEIVNLTNKSLQLAKGAGDVLEYTIPQVENTTRLIQEISASSKEQNSGANQVNNAIQQFTSITQQNAAASEQVATSAEELASQAEQLKDAISFFNTGYSSNNTNNPATQNYFKRSNEFKRNDRINQNDSLPNKFNLNLGDNDFEKY